MSSGRWWTPTSSDRSAHLIVSYSMGRGPRVPSLRRSPWARRDRRHDVRASPSSRFNQKRPVCRSFSRGQEPCR